MRLFSLDAKTPRLDSGAWVADSATVVGDVRLGPNSSVWFNAVLRGDNDPITVGANSNIQDGSILHTDEGVPLSIGDNVTVGHKVMLHGCTIGDTTLIGIGSIVLNRAVIGRHTIVGANTLIPEGKAFRDGVLIVGSPGRIIRDLDPAEIARLAQSAAHYVDNARRFATRLKPVPRD